MEPVTQKHTESNVGAVITTARGLHWKFYIAVQRHAILSEMSSISLCFMENLPFGSLVYVLRKRDLLVADAEGKGECLLFGNL